MAADLSREQDAARKQVMESEQEIQSIKNQLRRLQNAAGDNADGANSIEICWLKVRLVVLSHLPALVLSQGLLSILSVINFHSVVCACVFACHGPGGFMTRGELKPLGKGYLSDIK